jgi:hypothetical protein
MSRRVRVDVRWRDLDPEDVSDGVLRPGATFVDSARSRPLDEALSVADSALRHGDLTAQGMLGLAEQVPTTGRTQCLRVAREASGLAANPFESVPRAIAVDVPGLDLRPQLLISETAGPDGRISSTGRSGSWWRPTRSSSTVVARRANETVSGTTRSSYEAGSCSGSRGST